MSLTEGTVVPAVARGVTGATAVGRPATEDPTRHCAILSAGGGSEALIIDRTTNVDSRDSDMEDCGGNSEADVGTRFSASKELVGIDICM